MKICKIYMYRAFVTLFDTVDETINGVFYIAQCWESKSLFFMLQLFGEGHKEIYYKYRELVHFDIGYSFLPLIDYKLRKKIQYLFNDVE